MAARFVALVPRLIALTVIWLLGAATYSLAAGGGSTTQSQAPETVAVQPPKVVVVPDVRNQTYVFAKGMLQDAGFAWRVEGNGRGYSTDLVAVQLPAPGTKVVDNGTPTVLLRLKANPGVSPRGIPQKLSPYPGTRVLLLSEWKKVHAPKPKAKPKAKPKVEKKSEPPAKKKKAEAPAKKNTEKSTDGRKPDFVVAGAPTEPTDEMPLPDRARLVEARVGRAAKPSPKLVRFWLYQHTWIVTGARFGWSRGDEALRILIRVDQSLERRFGFGARSAAVARRALAYVEAHKR